ncbi:acyl dehydratase [Mycobacterium antarcticum]|uniref:Zn-ribbon domain-containing OB-fold protein n=1 Tax=unclassified Mycolicibacterium TaxID=2636767 RepID=UPI0023901C48|nr:MULTISPECIES: OB-fold domain-containing protein [unclassified Mycolicibacterium]BDX33492.1 acyl dehydratase [Mycolicibacterium sp. TUM20985]GLP82897.1 acyl dehydratase [Mycolicibacterium sp. TUM20984]
MSAMSRPIPIPTPTTQPFWDALSEHKIRIQYSPSTNQYVFYPRILAPGTLADDLEWREIGGGGSLYTFTVSHRAVSPHFADDVPQILAVVQWDEGPRFSTEIVNAEPGVIRVGMRVRPVFTDYPDAGITMLRYEPSNSP